MILYEGPSMLDGEPIVVIATKHSSNRKTGDMVQTWILRRDVPPKEAVDKGLDESVCGNCPQRRHLEGACYVEVWQAPGRVFATYQRGNYAKATQKDIKRLRGRAIRFGAYGDPAAAPVEIWANLARWASITTGYTHQIGHPNFDPEILNYCMVSTETPEATAAHQYHGRRTFRVKESGDPLMNNEILCPASTKNDVQCIDCGLCSSALGNGKSIAIDAHGTMRKKFQTIQVTQVA